MLDPRLTGCQESNPSKVVNLQGVGFLTTDQQGVPRQDSPEQVQFKIAKDTMFRRWYGSKPQLYDPTGTWGMILPEKKIMMVCACYLCTHLVSFILRTSAHPHTRRYVRCAVLGGVRRARLVRVPFQPKVTSHTEHAHTCTA
jgi:hypothetical protein